MTPAEIAELRALAGAATPGPYRADGYDVLCPDDSDAPRGYTPHVYFAQDCTPGSAAYIAAACNAVPRLCDEIERLRRIAEAARRVAHRGEHTGDCIGASGGACFEDDRDECECGLTTLRNALKGRE